MRIYTRTGDTGMTALLASRRVRKDHPAIETNGCVDEAQAALGLARAQCVDPGLNALLASLESDLWIVMAEVAIAPAGRKALVPGKNAVTSAMVERLEALIDTTMSNLDLAPAFAIPGENPCSAALDLARTIVRRAERHAVGLGLQGSLVVAYLNRLSDLCWALARATEAEHPTEPTTPRGGARAATRRAGPAAPSTKER